MTRSYRLCFTAALALGACALTSIAEPWPRFDFRDTDRHPISQAAFEGEEVRLIAQSSADSFDETTYQWWKDGEKLSGTNVTNLVMGNLSSSDAGVYYAVASNRFGEAISREARVEVICRPPMPGRLDSSFFGVATMGNDDNVRAIAIDPRGRVLVAGKFDRYGESLAANIVRLLPDGSIDPEFNAGTGANAQIRCIAIHGDSIWIGGSFTEFNGTACMRVLRLSDGGSIAAGFQTSTGPESDVRTILPDTNGSAIIGGTFKKVGMAPTGNLSRVFDDGSVDLDFLPAINGNVEDMARDGQNRIVLVGNFVIGGYSRIARIDSAGKLDLSFFQGTGSSAPVSDVAIQSDGAIVVSGRFTRIHGGRPRRGLARLHPDGEFDPSLNVTPLGGDVDDIVLDAKDRIIIGGGFDTVNGKRCANLARIRPAGDVDPDFITAQLDGDVKALAIAASGGIVVGGEFEVPHRSLLQLTSDPLTRPLSPVLCEPEDWSTIAGGVARFSVVATAATPIGYQWFHDDIRIDGAENSTFEIFRVSDADRGLYHCELVIDDVVIESTRAVLAVEPPPHGALKRRHFGGDRNVEGVDYDGGERAVLETFIEVTETVPIGDVDVTFSLDHNDTSLLTVKLVFEPAQGGRDIVVSLFARQMPGGFGFVRTMIDDEATRSLLDVLPPYVGSSRTQGKVLSAFDGLVAKGTWRLQVFDRLEDGKVATLKSWELIIGEREDDVSYDAWALDYFESASPPTSDSDSDGDGIENLLDYLMGRRRKESLPQSVHLEESTVAVRYRRRNNLMGYSIVYEVSHDLSVWQQMEPYVIVRPGRYQQVQLLSPIRRGAARSFIRMRVE